MNRRAIFAALFQPLLGLAAVAVLIAAITGTSRASGDDQPAKTDAKPAAKLNPYPLGTCIVSGEKLGEMGKPVVKEYDGREVRFCCKGCVKDFEADKAGFMKKIDDKIIDQQLPHYPLKNCVVNVDDELGAEGMEPVNLVYNNRLVRLCCKDCLKDFNAEPTKYLKRIDDAVIKEQKPNYPMDTCPVSSEKLGAEAVDYVSGVTLIRFCCKDCIEKFNADPLPVIAKLHEAWKAKQGKGHADEPAKKDAGKGEHEGHNHGG